MDRVTMGERVAVSAAVAVGLEVVRKDGACNMLDRPCVVDALFAFGYDEAAFWVEANRDLYAKLIFHGMTVVEEG